MATLKGLCMKDRDSKNKPTMQEMTSVTVSEKKGRWFAKGKCAKCGGNMFKFMSAADAAKFK